MQKFYIVKFKKMADFNLLIMFPTMLVTNKSKRHVCLTKLKITGGLQTQSTPLDKPVIQSYSITVL